MNTNKKEQEFIEAYCSVEENKFKMTLVFDLREVVEESGEISFDPLEIFKEFVSRRLSSDSQSRSEFENEFH